LTRPTGRSIALATALFVATSAFADTVTDEDAQSVQAVIDALRAGDFSAAAAKLREKPSVERLTARPDLVYVLCDRAYRYDKHSGSADARRTIAARLLEVAGAAAAAQPTDDRLRWALADATVLRERTGRTGPEAWSQAADLLEKVHASKPNDGLALDYAVTFLLEGACSEPDATSALIERADALARKAMEAQKDSPTLAAAIATQQFWCAKTLLASNRKMARNELKATLDTLRPFAAKPNPTADVATTYNDAVAFGRVNGFVLPDKFVDAARPTLGASIQVDVPVSSRWFFQTVAATADTAAYDYVTEMSPEGKRVRQVLFRRWGFSDRYVFEDKNPVGGDNCRGLSQGLQAQALAHIFAPGAKAETPSRCSIPKSLDGYQFDVRGTTPSADGAPGEPLRLKAYILRGRSKACYGVLLYVYGKDDELGPELENLISSLREVEK
jgi:hypothetical protein